MGNSELVKAGVKLFTAIFSFGFAGKVAKEGRINYQTWQKQKTERSKMKY